MSTKKYSPKSYVVNFHRQMSSRARSIQPKFPEISAQNSMDRFGPTGKVSKKLVHLLRWTSFFLWDQSEFWWNGSRPRTDLPMKIYGIAFTAQPLSIKARQLGIAVGLSTVQARVQRPFYSRSECKIFL